MAVETVDGHIVGYQLGRWNLWYYYESLGVHVCKHVNRSDKKCLTKW